VIPTQAVIPVQNGKVFISDFGKAKVMVETATRTDASLLILSGLQGDTVITSGVMALKK
jgi:membrane fusion protein (multidrug efflux system)